MADIKCLADIPVMSDQSDPRRTDIVLASVYLLATIAASPSAYASTLWLTPSERGWQTQAAAGGLVVGWGALAIAALLAWQAINAKRRPRLIALAALSLIAATAYFLAAEWGGRMLI